MKIDKHYCQSLDYNLTIFNLRDLSWEIKKEISRSIIDYFLVSIELVPYCVTVNESVLTIHFCLELGIDCTLKNTPI